MDLDVYVSPTCTNGARCGDRRRYLYSGFQGRAPCSVEDPSISLQFYLLNKQKRLIATTSLVNLIYGLSFLLSDLSFGFCCSSFIRLCNILCRDCDAKDRDNVTTIDHSGLWLVWRPVENSVHLPHTVSAHHILQCTAPQKCVHFVRHPAKLANLAARANTPATCPSHLRPYSRRKSESGSRVPQLPVTTGILD